MRRSFTTNFLLILLAAAVWVLLSTPATEAQATHLRPFTPGHFRSSHFGPGGQGIEHDEPHRQAHRPCRRC